MIGINLIGILNHVKKVKIFALKLLLNSHNEFKLLTL